MSEQIYSNPETRTAAFTNQDLYLMADQMIEGEGMVMVVYGTSRKVRIIKVDPWSKQRVGERNDVMAAMNPGDLWSPPERQILQALVVAKDKDGVGACVRIERVEFYDASSQSFVETLTEGDVTYGQREGDIAKYLGLGKFERNKIQFQDATSTLYVVPDGEILPRISHKRK